MSERAKQAAVSITAARDQIACATDLLAASLTGLKGERRSTLRYGYLVARALGVAALSRAHDRQWTLRGDTRKNIRRSILAVEAKLRTLIALERKAIAAGALSLSLVLDEVTEQLIERNLEVRHAELLDLAESGKPLIEPLLSADERICILEYAYERVSKRLVFDSLAAVFGNDGQTMYGDAPVSAPSHDLQSESSKTMRQDIALVKAFADRQTDLENLIRAAFAPFLGVRLNHMPPFEKPPSGKLF